MKKILLVYLASNANKILDFPVGVYSLKTYLELNYQDKCVVEVKDLQLNRMQDIVDYVLHWKPDILGMSLMIGASQLLDRFIKMFYSQASSSYQPLFILGKNIATDIYPEILRKYPQTICVKGEGEIAIGGLLEYVCGIKQLSEVNNIAYIENGQLKETHPQFLQDLSIIGPINYQHAAPYIALGGNVWVETSRGCPWGKCTFCSIKNYWGNSGWRNKPIDIVINELQIISKLGVRKVLFTDEEFFGYGIKGLQRAEKLALEIINKKIDLSFYANARASSIFNKDDTLEQTRFRIKVLKHLKKAGLQTIYLGIESGSFGQLKRFNKGISLLEAEKAIKVCEELNLEMAIGILMLEPLTTPKEFLDNINFITRNRIIPYLSKPLNKLKVYPRIPYYQLIHNEEAVSSKQLLGKNINLNESVFEIRHFKSEAVEKIVEFAEKYYEGEEALYNGLRWFLRFHPNAHKEEFRYLRYHTEMFKEYQLYLLKNICELSTKRFFYAKACSVLRDAYKKRNYFIASLRREIITNKHAKLCKSILNQIEKYFFCRSKPEYFNKINHEYLIEKKVFSRYGYGADSELPSGVGHYGVSLVVALEINDQLKKTINWIKEQLMETKAFINKKIIFVPNDAIHHTLKNLVSCCNNPVAENYIKECYNDIKEKVQNIAAFKVNFDGIGWGVSYPYIAIKTIGGAAFRNLEKTVKNAFYPEIDFKLAVIVWELTTEELRELNTLIFDLSLIPVGSFMVNKVILLHHQNDLAINSLSRHAILLKGNNDG